MCLCVSVELPKLRVLMTVDSENKSMTAVNAKCWLCDMRAILLQTSSTTSDITSPYNIYVKETIPTPAYGVDVW